MTEPKELQRRVAAAFDGREPSRADDPADDFLPHQPYMPLIDPDLEAPGESDAGSDRHAMMRYWLAGGGLVATAIVLAMGTSSGFTLLAVCLGAIGVASILFSMAEKLETKLEAKGGAEPLESRTENIVPVAGDNSFSAAGDLLASIHDALGDITVCRNLSGRILTANNTFKDLVGCPNPEGRTCEELGLVFQPGLIEHSYDVQIERASGNRVFLWHDVVAPDPMLGDLVVQSIARDVTDERNDMMLREAARQKAEEESGLKSRLIATVSHEIRTPLSGLLGMGHLLAGTKLSAEQKNYLDGIRQSGTALVQLVEDLLDFSTLAAGRFQLRPRQEAIRPLVENMVEMLSSRAHAKGIEIGASIDPRLPETLVFDPARLRQVVYNVIGNAVKFTETGGILVTVAGNGDFLEIVVKDSGPGMNAAELQRIFGEFEQGDLTRAREGGVGLGLAISARIMAEAGGSLGVESALGEGSTFTIRMPVKIEGAPHRNGEELADARVLLMAPSGPAAEALVRTLGDLGARVILASDIDGVHSALSRSSDLTGVIVDHRLDSIFCDQLARDPRLAGAKKVYLVNPEARPAQMSGTNYDSWLIRPLREQSLIDVLKGRLKGLEPRAAANDDFPVLSAEPVEEASEAEPQAAKSNGLSILLGEDDPVNAMIVQAMLEKVGHRVRLTDSFNRLKAMSAEENADIVVTDYSMPDGTCENFIADLRGKDEFSHTPVIVLTADNSDGTRRSLLLNGADLVLIKPAGPDILNRAIEKLTTLKNHAA
jgi:signal transduction histidine kinase/CheY-like chemotaxis protein